VSRLAKETKCPHLQSPHNLSLQKPKRISGKWNVSAVRNEPVGTSIDHGTGDDREKLGAPNRLRAQKRDLPLKAVRRKESVDHD
ncbi:MAG: hypothetical protein ABEK50_11150, partial [bacterium]